MKLINDLNEFRNKFKKLMSLIFQKNLVDLEVISISSIVSIYCRDNLHISIIGKQINTNNPITILSEIGFSSRHLEYDINHKIKLTVYIEEKDYNLFDYLIDLMEKNDGSLELYLKMQ